MINLVLIVHLFSASTASITKQLWKQPQRSI